MVDPFPSHSSKVCRICRNRPADSGEHLIPGAIGGRRIVYGVLCGPCNSTCGSGIEAAMTKLKASQGKNLTQDQFAEMQEKLGELQGRIGEIQGEIGSKQGEFGERMGELGSKMGELGEQMGRLGEQQGKIASQADQKVKSIIDQSLKDGKAHPIQ